MAAVSGAHDQRRLCGGACCAWGVCARQRYTPPSARRIASGRGPACSVLHPNGAQTNSGAPRCCRVAAPTGARTVLVPQPPHEEERAMHDCTVQHPTGKRTTSGVPRARMQHASCAVRRAAGSRGRVRDARARQGACGPRVCPSFHTVRPPALARSAPPPQPLPQPAGASPPPATGHIQRVTSGVEMRALVSRQSRVSRLPTVPAC